MRVLVISPRIPFPPVGGASLRTSYLLRALVPEHEVTLVAFDYGEGHDEPPFPVEVVSVPWEWPDAYRAMRDGDALESERAFAELDADDGEPWFVSCVASTAFESALHDLASEPFDVALVEETAMGRFLPRLPPGCPAVLDMHNVHTRMALNAPFSDDHARREGVRTLRFERDIAAACSLLLVVSDLEATAARELLRTDSVHVVPNGVDTAALRPAPDAEVAERVLFVGRMDYEPNVDAVRRFATEAWPTVRERRPAASFHIVGTDPVPEVRGLAGESVFVHGQVDDVRPHYERAAVVVAPLRSGGGTRLKLLEAAAAGKAIVTTAVGMEGLDLQPGRDLVVAEEPAETARQVVALLGDPDRRGDFGRNARAASLAYDWAGIGADFRGALEETARARAELAQGAA